MRRIADVFERPLPRHPKWVRAVLETAASPLLRAPRALVDPRDAGRAPWVDVELRTDGLRLAAYAAIQDGGGPGLLLAHGHNSSIDETRFVANAAWERGFSVFIFEFRACGKSEGRLGALTRFETLELEAAARVFRALLPEGAPFGVHGFSMGAAAVINALKRGLPATSVSLDCPFATLDETIPYYTRRLPPTVRPFVGVSTRAAELLFGVEAREIRPIDGVEHIPVPALFIVSTNDQLVPPWHSEQLATRWGGPVELWRVDGAWHCEARFDAAEEYVERLVAWHSRVA